MVDIQTGVEENTIGLIQQFAEVAMIDPLVAAMLVTGAILTAFAAGFFGVLALGGVLVATGRGLSGDPEPIRQAR